MSRTEYVGVNSLIPHRGATGNTIIVKLCGPRGGVAAGEITLDDARELRDQLARAIERLEREAT